MHRHSARLSLTGLAGIVVRPLARHIPILAVIGGALSAACGGGSKSVDPGGAGPATTIEAQTATSFTGTTGTAVTIKPAVHVTDADGLNVLGAAVTFAVTGGGGSITGANATTNASGIATVGSWTLGTAGANTLTASAAGLTGSPVTFTATAAAPVSQFSITLQYTNGASPSQMAAFEAARTRWQQVVIGDLSNVNVGTNQDVCGSGNPVSGVIDDLLILVTLDSIDGPGQILGAAGPCIVRASNSLTVVGQMTFDTADLATLENAGNLGDVILHEMGHVLGIGSLWNVAGFTLVSGACVDDGNQVAVAGTGVDPRFIGGQATAAYTGSNGGAGSNVPVENFPGSGNNCPNGTRDSHWEEDIFKSELMTGFISGTVRPMSLTTVRSLADLGYTVDNSQADAFNINTQPTLRADGIEAPRFSLQGDVRKGPIRTIDDSPGAAPPR